MLLELQFDHLRPGVLLNHRVMVIVSSSVIVISYTLEPCSISVRGPYSHACNCHRHQRCSVAVVVPTIVVPPAVPIVPVVPDCCFQFDRIWCSDDLAICSASFIWVSYWIAIFTSPSSPVVPSALKSCQVGIVTFFQFIIVKWYRIDLSVQ